MMSSKERDAVFKRCIREYGANSQIDKAVEEMSELVKALMKYRWAIAADLNTARADVIDELADVRIMARQMEILLDCESEVEHRIDAKINRQIGRLESRNSA